MRTNHSEDEEKSIPLLTMLLYQAYSAFANFRGKLAWFVHGSIFSGVGASSNIGAVHTGLVGKNVMHHSVDFYALAAPTFNDG